MDKYRIRRAILEAVEVMEPGLAELDDVGMCPLLSMAAVQPGKILEEVRGLVDHGLLNDARPGRAPLIRLTAAGRDQLHQETDLDEFVWGTMASKFQK